LGHIPEPSSPFDRSVTQRDLQAFRRTGLKMLRWYVGVPIACLLIGFAGLCFLPRNWPGEGRLEAAFGSGRLFKIAS
jgi:hypothetical protein